MCQLRCGKLATFKILADGHGCKFVSHSMVRSNFLFVIKCVFDNYIYTHHCDCSGFTNGGTKVYAKDCFAMTETFVSVHFQVQRQMEPLVEKTSGAYRMSVYLLAK